MYIYTIFPGQAQMAEFLCCWQRKNRRSKEEQEEEEQSALSSPFSPFSPSLLLAHHPAAFAAQHCPPMAWQRGLGNPTKPPLPRHCAVQAEGEATEAATETEAAPKQLFAEADTMTEAAAGAVDVTTEVDADLRWGVCAGSAGSRAVV